MNTFDKIVDWFSPAAGYRRARYRAATAGVRNAYEGAKTGRRANTFTASGASANSEISVALPALRDRSRDLIRNNYLARNAQGKWHDCIVGPGILCQWEDPAVQEKWDAWSKNSSADGLPHFEALQSLVCNAEFESGEVLARFRPRRRSDGVWPPFQVQILESDYLDSSKTQNTDTGYILHGVERDRIGRTVAYWLFEQHPGDPISTVKTAGTASRRISAEQICHVFEPLRPGQVRGVPRLSPVTIPTKDVADWEEAELVRKRTESCIAGAVLSPEGENFTFTEEVQDAAGNQVSTFEPGMILKLKPGEEVSWNVPRYAGGYDEYKSSRQRDIAAGLQIPFELLTGNYSKSNYSSSRMGGVAFGRRVISHQWNVIIPLFCERIAQEFIRQLEMFEGGEINRRHDWNPPAYELLDRLSEVKADQLELQIGRSSWPQVVKRAGNEVRKHLDEVKQYSSELQDAGIGFFSQPPDNEESEGANGSTAKAD